MTQTPKGKVYLVGAGPGHPKLITVRGMECIQQCDVIVYDRLASPSLLRHLKPGAEKIYVGKLPDRHTMKQEEINQLLVDLALQGKTVTRLKGGDPSIFGRVGEEAELLVDNGVEYEIVPGITSAIAVPTYAGIPVTHRDLASSISIITGHESPDKLDRSIKWDKVTNATGTLIFLMGVAKIGYIAEQLMKHGCAADTPVALIRWGTRVEQRTVVGTLATIADIVREAQFKPPAVIVVGDVVKQREKLQWVEKRPLFGKRVLITRARAQSSELATLIEQYGGEPLEFPVIEMRAVRQPEAIATLHAALAQAEQYDWLMFTSVNGVDYFMQTLIAQKIDIRRFYRARIAAVGPKTAEALTRYGIVADVLPVQFQAEGLLTSLEDHLQAGQHVLLPRGDLAREVLPRELQRRGLQTTEVDVYENVIAEDQDEQIYEWLLQGKIDVITFASSSTVKNLIKIMQQYGCADVAGVLNQAAIACIGPVTAQTAREASLNVTIMPDEATMTSFVAQIAATKLADRIFDDEGE